MKKIIAILSSAFLLSSVFAVDSSYFINEKSGKGLTVKVEPSTTRTLKSGDLGYSDMVDMQNKIISLITNYSEISVVTDQARKAAVNELRTSQSDLFDEENALEVGNFKAATYTISSTMNLAASENSNYRRYVLSLQVTNTETGSLVWSSNNPAKHTQHDFSTGVALNEQGVALLEALGVSLSETGKQKITNLNINQVNREQALAKAASAATQVEKLYYGYDAANYGATNAELIKSNNELASLLKASKSSGSVRDAALAEKTVYEAYKKNLADVDEFFTENPPFKIVYDNTISYTTELTSSKEVVANITSHIVAYPTKAAEQLIGLFRDGIKAAGEDSIVYQEYHNWPFDGYYGYGRSSYIWSDANNFVVRLELSDDKGNVLSSAYAQLPQSRYEREEHSTQYGSYYTYGFTRPGSMASVTFHDVNPEDITDKLVIEIVGIETYDSYRNRNRSYYSNSKNDEGKYDLNQFQIRSLSEYQAETLKEYEAADKANKQKGRSMFSLNLIGGFRDDIKEPVGVSVSGVIGFGKYLFIGGDVGLLNFYKAENDIAYDGFGTVYAGVNKYFTTKFCVFAEGGFSIFMLDSYSDSASSPITLHLGAGADFLIKSDYNSTSDLFSKDGITAKLSFDYDLLGKRWLPIATVGFGFSL